MLGEALKCKICLIPSVVIFVLGVVLGLISWNLLPTEQTSSSSANTGERSVPTLQFVVVISRHGNRAPLVTYPTDPYLPDDPTFWPYGRGQLTNLGRRQMYNLGRKIRALYNGFLNETFNLEDFKAHSTLVERTMMSGQAFLAGLYPPKGFQVWSRDMIWQPVPIFPTYLDKCMLLVFPASCPRLQQAQEDALKRYELEFGGKAASLVDYLKTNFNIQDYGIFSFHVNQTISVVTAVCDTITCANVEGLTLPDWAQPVYPEPLKDLAHKAYLTLTGGSDFAKRVGQGLLFKEIIGFMDSKTSGTLKPDRKMVYYSAHDLTLLGLMHIAGVEGPMVSPGSALIFELHRDLQSDKFYVEVRYIDGQSERLKPTTVDIPGCKDPCDIHTFMDMTRQYHNITSLEDECQIL